MKLPLNSCYLFAWEGRAQRILSAGPANPLRMRAHGRHFSSLRIGFCTNFGYFWSIAHICCETGWKCESFTRLRAAGLEYFVDAGVALLHARPVMKVSAEASRHKVGLLLTRRFGAARAQKEGLLTRQDTGDVSCTQLRDRCPLSVRRRRRAFARGNSEREIKWLISWRISGGASQASR